MEQLLSKILEIIKKAHEIQAMRDLYFMCRECMKTDIKTAVRYLAELSAECEKAIANGKDGYV